MHNRSPEPGSMIRYLGIPSSRSRLKGEAARTGHRRDVLERQLPPRSAEMKDATVGWRRFSKDVRETLDPTVGTLCRSENYGVVTRTSGVRSRCHERTYTGKSSRRRTTEGWREGGRCAKGRQGSGLPTRFVGGVVMVSGPVIYIPRQHDDCKPKSDNGNAEDSSTCPSLH